MAVSKRLRFEILRRDNHACRYCGATAPGVKLVVDHVVPDALGGKTVPENLVACCEPCNSGKSSVAPDAPLVDGVNNDAVRWARAMATAADIHRANREAREAFVNYFLEVWGAWTYGPQDAREKVPLGDGWQSTVEKFFAYALDPDDLVYAVRTAMENERVPPASTFRYFCGVCWNMLREMQETAADLVMAEVRDEAEADDDPWRI